MSADETNPKSDGDAAPDPASDKPKTWLGRSYRRAKKGYDVYDNASTAWDLFQWIRTPLESLFVTAKANVAATAAAATVATTATAATVVAVVEPELLTSLFEDAPAEPVVERVETIRWGEAVVFPIDGVDGEGLEARFDVAVLPTDFAWERASADALTRDGARLDAAAIETVVFAPPLRAGLAESAGLIAVGAASQEGNLEVETRRAGDRAETAALWLRSYVSETAPIYTLNLGQYQPSCGADASDGASWQRPVLFIGVREAATGVDLSAALVDAIADKSNLPDRACYSAFALEPASPPRE